MPELVREVEFEFSKWRVRYRLNLALLYGTLILWIAEFVVGYPTHRVPSPYQHFIFFGMIFVFGSEGIGLLTRLTHRHRQVIQNLTEGEGTALVGPLLEARQPAWIAGIHAFKGDKTLYFAVIATLTCLLPQLSEAEYRTLTPMQRKALYGMLKNEHIEVVKPALQLVTRMGDNLALPILERLARGKGGSPLAKRKRQVVQETLPQARRQMR